MFQHNAAPMFGAWQSFYQMTGETAATLIGLLFIVVSLSAGLQSAASERGLKLFTTPTMFHLVSILVLSALALAPDGDGGPPSGVMTAWSIVALLHTGVRAIEIRHLRDPAHWSDFWWYGAAPALTYAALVAANAAAWAHLTHAAYGVAACLLVLLVTVIRNAWDLITWLAPRRGGGGGGPGTVSGNGAAGGSDMAAGDRITEAHGSSGSETAL